MATSTVISWKVDARRVQTHRRLTMRRTTQTTGITTEKDERAAWIQRRRANHHKALETLAYQVGCDTQGLALWRQLKRLESWLSVYSTQHCNGDIDSNKWEEVKQTGKNRLSRIFG